MAGLTLGRGLLAGLLAGALLAGCGSSGGAAGPSASNNDGQVDEVRDEVAVVDGGDVGDDVSDDVSGDVSDDAPAIDDAGTFMPPARCALPFDPGPCKAAIRVFAFAGAACAERIYGGCQGNDNRFTTLEECRVTCEGRD